MPGDKHRWTPDEIVLTIEAWHRITRQPMDRDLTLDALADTLGVGRPQAEAAVNAVGRPDKLGARMLVALIFLRDEPKELSRLAELIRARWKRHS